MNAFLYAENSFLLEWQIQMWMRSRNVKIKILKANIVVADRDNGMNNCLHK